MGLFSKKKQALDPSLEVARNELMDRLGNKYYVPSTFIVKNNRNGVRVTLTTLVVVSQNPLQFNPTLLPTDAEYVVFQVVNAGKMESLGIIALQDFLGMLRYVNRQVHELKGFGTVEYFEINAEYPVLTFAELQGRMKQLNDLE